MEAKGDLEKMIEENEKFFNEFFCSETHKVRPISVPSLQHVTMVKITIELWNQIDLKESIVNLKFTNDERSSWQEWREIEEKALLKVAQLPLPKPLKREFLSVISPIGVEIKNWWVYHRRLFNLLTFPKHFVWTSRGTIDKVKTARGILENEEVDLEERYKLACWYCLEEVIPEIWKRVVEERERNYFTIEDDGNEMKPPFLVRFWAYYLKVEFEKSFWVTNEGDQFWATYEGDQLWRSLCLYAFWGSVHYRNKAALEFFLDKLNHDESDQLDQVLYSSQSAINRLLRELPNETNPKEYYTELFLFLLPRLNEYQRKDLFTRWPYELLNCLFEWPNRPLFVELAERTLHLIPEVVIGSIIKNVANGWSDCTNQQLFYHFWNFTPLSYKRRAIERIHCCTMMKLYERKDEEIVRALFKHACAVEKEGLIMCKRRLDITARELMKWNGWEPMEETVVKLLEEFLEREKI